MSFRGPVAHIVDFLKTQPPDVYRFILNAIEPIWTDPKADIADVIKERYPGRFTDKEISLLIAGAMHIMK
jgi:hypothetical protein